MNFAFFILLNAILLIRPEELTPDSAGLRLYLIVILLCILTTLPQILSQFSPSSLQERPITVCALGLLVAMALSEVVHGRLDVFNEQVPEFAKVLLYFLLLMAIVNTPARLSAFMGWIVIFVIVLSTLGILQMNGYINIESIKPVTQQHTFDPESGTYTKLSRMVSSGIYNDPNDLCLILATGSLCCLTRSSLTSSIVMRFVWLCPIVWFIYAMTLTFSRGGMLGLGAGVVSLIYARFGARKTLPLSLLLIPTILFVFAGRQSNIDLGDSGDTSQGRIQIWAEGFNIVCRSPVSLALGIGVDQYVDEVGRVAHNSFVQAYVEMGFFGGALFLGAFYLAARAIQQKPEDGEFDKEPMLRRMRPFVFAMVIAYAAGSYSISRNFVVPTYMILGIAAAFIAMANYDGIPEWFRFDQRMVKRLAVVGAIGWIFLFLFTKSLVQWSS